MYSLQKLQNVIIFITSDTYFGSRNPNKKIFRLKALIKKDKYTNSFGLT